MAELDWASHNAKRREILEAINFEDVMLRMRKAAIDDFNNGGVGHITRVWYFPREAKRLVKSYSRNQLMFILKDASGPNTGVDIESMPGILKRGGYRITIYRV